MWRQECLRSINSLIINLLCLFKKGNPNFPSKAFASPGKSAIFAVLFKKLN